MRRVLITVVGAAMTNLIASAAPAQAHDAARLDARPERVVVNQQYENVRWLARHTHGRLANGADVELRHVRSRTLAGYSVDTDGSNGVGDTMRLYDYERMGRYVVQGQGYDFEYNSVELASDHIMVKRAARVRIDGDRHRRYVSLRARVKRYDGGYPTWKNHRSTRVVFQRRTSRGWRFVKAGRTNRRGVAAVTFRRAKRAPYRAVVKPTATVWGDRSGRIRR